ncbi:MAG: serpin family protein [Planctomycetota bacterium]
MSRSTDRIDSPVTIVQEFNALGFRLFSLLADEEKLFISPFSIAAVLAAARVGAKGDTEHVLARLVGAGRAPQAIAEEVRTLTDSLAVHRERQYHFDPETGVDEQREVEVFRLSLANALFVMLGYPLVPSYQDMLRDFFAAEISPVDFEAPDSAAGRINAWVSEHTEGRITSLISPAELKPDTRLLLVNTVYFLASWLDPFEEELTSPAPFHLLPDAETETVEVEMMRSTDARRYMTDGEGGFEAVELHYHAASMLVVLPAPGRFRNVEKALGPEMLERILGGLEERLVALQLPKFDVESSLRLATRLQTLGLDDAFNRDRADFSGITTDPKGLVLSEVIHRARIRVDEKGTEAVAATALTAELALGIDEEVVKPVPFVVDRPFLFLIRDRETGTVLFLGRVLNPVA